MLEEYRNRIHLSSHFQLILTHFESLIPVGSAVASTLCNIYLIGNVIDTVLGNILSHLRIAGTVQLASIYLVRNHTDITHGLYDGMRSKSYLFLHILFAFILSVYFFFHTQT